MREIQIIENNIKKTDKFLLEIKEQRGEYRDRIPQNNIQMLRRIGLPFYLTNNTYIQSGNQLGTTARKNARRLPNPIQNMSNVVAITIKPINPKILNGIINKTCSER